MQTGETIFFDKYEWRVLEKKEDLALLITENIITQRPYHNRPGEVTWADSELRAYLNGEFFSSFSEENRQRIIAASNNNPDNPWYGSRGGDKTKDHIFLLDLEEAVCRYFGDSSKNLENKSQKQRYWFQKKDVNNSRRRALYDGYIWWWWLRSPGRNNKRAVYIHGDGNVGIQGNGTYNYNSTTLHPKTHNNCGGVRPALWIKP